LGTGGRSCGAVFRPSGRTGTSAGRTIVRSFSSFMSSSWPEHTEGPGTNRGLPCLSLGGFLAEAVGDGLADAVPLLDLSDREVAIADLLHSRVTRSGRRERGSETEDLGARSELRRLLHGGSGGQLQGSRIRAQRLADPQLVLLVQAVPVDLE